MYRRVSLLLLASLLAFPQIPRNPRDQDHDILLPSGKSQKEEILKSEHEKTLKDASELLKLAEDLKAQLEKDDRYVLSVSALKQLDNIEKLTKKIRGRLKH